MTADRMVDRRQKTAGDLNAAVEFLDKQNDLIRLSFSEFGKLFSWLSALRR